MTTGMHLEPATYVFGRRDRGSLLLGFRAAQLFVLGVGVAAVLGGFIAAGGRGGLVGMLLLAGAAVIAVLPVQGRPLVDWARPVTNFAFQRITGRGRYLGGPRALHRCRDVPRLDLPSLGQQLRVLEAMTPSGPVAVLRLRDRWTVVLAVRGSN